MVFGKRGGDVAVGVVGSPIDSADLARNAPQTRPRLWLDMGTARKLGAGSARRVLEDARLLKAGLVKAAGSRASTCDTRKSKAASTTNALGQPLRPRARVVVSAVTRK